MLPTATLFNVNKSGYRIVSLSFFTFLRLKGIYKVYPMKHAGDSGGGGSYRTMLCLGNRSRTICEDTDLAGINRDMYL